MKNNFKQKGFTLLEVLIASAIFASMLVMATGIIAQTSNYQGRLKAMRETSEETRRLADMITRDVRSANKSDNFFQAIPFKNGIAILNKNSELILSSYDTSPNLSYTSVDLLLLANSNEYIAYCTNIIDGQSYLFRKTYTSDFTKANIVNFITTFALSKENAISNKNLNVTLSFAGFTPGFSPDGSVSIDKQQPFIRFKTTAETVETTGANHYRTEIDSTVTGRSYNQ